METTLLQPKAYCIRALERLFKKREECGFWDAKFRRIHGKLLHDEEWNWMSDINRSDRYGVFALSMVLLAKKVHQLETRDYDEKIKSYICYIDENFEKMSLEGVTYGAGNALILAQELYPELSVVNGCESVFLRVSAKMGSVQDNQKSLILIGLCEALRICHQQGKRDLANRIFNYVHYCAQELLSSQDENGFFQTGDLRAFHHQRVMYPLWALAFCAQWCMKKEIQSAIERSLHYIWSHRQESEDCAFLWHPIAYTVKSPIGIILPNYLPRSAEYLFECHQTFFANAISMYQSTFETENFEDQKREALSWIFGQNRCAENLVDISGIDVPVRIMSRNCRLLIEEQMFKGSYEIGSYIYALSDPKLTTLS